MFARTTVAIVGGGLAGLHAARLLNAAGIDIQVLEARDRLGGRILSADDAGRVSDDGFDLGPSWFWPKMQPALGALVQELGLATFPQHGEGDVVFERMSRETPQRYRGVQQDPQSMRLVGGTGALVTALARGIPQQRLWLGASVRGLTMGDTEVTLHVRASDGTAHVVAAAQVIAALPPRLLEATCQFAPSVDGVSARRWRDTPTWMAPHAKFFARYDRPFWREAGLSGTAQSMVGPLAEIHDATTASGAAALFGFLGVGAEQRAAVGEEALTDACVQHLARLFGPEARAVRATWLKDWAADALTATSLDRQAAGHPAPGDPAWVSGPWAARLSLAGSETSATESGYMAGAIAAAARAVAETRARLARGA